MIRRGFDALYHLDRAAVGFMIDKPDSGQSSAVWQILDCGRWVADVDAPVADHLIRKGLVEDVSEPDFGEPFYRLSYLGRVYLYQAELIAEPEPLDAAPLPPDEPNGPTRMMRRLQTAEAV